MTLFYTVYKGQLTTAKINMVVILISISNMLIKHAYSLMRRHTPHSIIESKHFDYHSKKIEKQMRKILTCEEMTEQCHMI